MKINSINEIQINLVFFTLQMGVGGEPPTLLMRVWLLLLVSVVLTKGQMAPCNFNMMCTCRYGPPGVSSRYTALDSMPQVIEVQCVGVTFARLPSKYLTLILLSKNVLLNTNF